MKYVHYVTDAKRTLSKKFIVYAALMHVWSLCGCTQTNRTKSFYRRYYDPDALMSDSVTGNMVAGLLVGPCALEYMKEALLDEDNRFNGFTVSELLQRNQFRST
ncbi:hypothetical protein M513_14191, partial [Trichuris suis]